jgi:hypothetical protein
MKVIRSVEFHYYGAHDSSMIYLLFEGCSDNDIEEIHPDDEFVYIGDNTYEQHCQ